MRQYVSRYYEWRNFSPGPSISFRSVWKLSSYLVRAGLYPLQVGSSKCGKRRWQVCNNVTDTSICTRTVAGNTLRLTTVWAVMVSVLSTNICKQVKLQISFLVDGVTIKTMLESLTRVSLVCKNTHINIFRLTVPKAF